MPRPLNPAHTHGNPAARLQRTIPPAIESRATPSFSVTPMQTLNIRQFRSVIPKLQATLEREHEIVLVSNGVPVARVLPVASPGTKGRIQSTAAFREQFGSCLHPDSTPDIRAERDAR